ncbi:acetolactate synthase small subunit [Photobacterium jeanii]|uniref:Acetolactate synthase small subunit n=1 Tax=Photobacterium jeanii TaxID=858640 RepID=A0A178KR49_9GAMM|nr:acetolactate synthase small subunit [Photobacterium jeanii]OAN19022.1 acetolactate synthase small subunit [Photobacterium jeanii]PST87685.1 acetolactate synthase small subunit [Photobacterium jeanii]
MRRIVSVLLENESGSLSRVVGLFSQRGYNIESLTVAPTDDHTLSRLNITTNVEDDAALEQIEKQLHKLIDILKVSNVTETEHVERELMLVKVKASGFARAEVKRTADIFRGQIVDVTSQIYTIQLAGTSDKLDAFISAVSEATEIIEVARSGVVGVARGERALKA